MFKGNLSSKCKNCGAVISTASADAGKVGSCPQCGNEMRAPFPGIGRGAYWGYKALALGVGTFVPICPTLVDFQKWMFVFQGPDVGLLIWLIPGILFELLIASLRAVHIGLKPWWCLIELIPFTWLFFGLAPEGSAKLKNSRSFRLSR